MMYLLFFRKNSYFKPFGKAYGVKKREVRHGRGRAGNPHVPNPAHPSLRAALSGHNRVWFNKLRRVRVTFVSDRFYV